MIRLKYKTETFIEDDDVWDMLLVSINNGARYYSCISLFGTEDKEKIEEYINSRDWFETDTTVFFSNGRAIHKSSFIKYRHHSIGKASKRIRQWNNSSDAKRIMSYLIKNKIINQ